MKLQAIRIEITCNLVIASRLPKEVENRRVQQIIDNFLEDYAEGHNLRRNDLDVVLQFKQD